MNDQKPESKDRVYELDIGCDDGGDWRVPVGIALAFALMVTGCSIGEGIAKSGITIDQCLALRGVSK